MDIEEVFARVGLALLGGVTVYFAFKGSSEKVRRLWSSAEELKHELSDGQMGSRSIE